MEFYVSNRLQRWFVLLAGIGCLTGCGGLQAVFDPVDFAGDKQAEAVPEGGEYTSASVGRIGSGLFEDEYEGEALVVEGYYSQPMGQYTNAFERANDRVAGMIYEEDPAAQLRAQLPKQNPDGTFQMADPQQMGAATPQKTLMLSLTDCTSFVAMRDRDLTDALTGDHHFEQAGFTPRLRA